MTVRITKNEFGTTKLRSFELGAVWIKSEIRDFIDDVKEHVRSARRNFPTLNSFLRSGTQSSDWKDSGKIVSALPPQLPPEVTTRTVYEACAIDAQIEVIAFKNAVLFIAHYDGLRVVQNLIKSRRYFPYRSYYSHLTWQFRSVDGAGVLRLDPELYINATAIAQNNPIVSTDGLFAVCNAINGLRGRVFTLRYVPGGNSDNGRPNVNRGYGEAHYGAYLDNGYLVTGLTVRYAIYTMAMVHEYTEQEKTDISYTLSPSTECIPSILLIESLPRSRRRSYNFTFTIITQGRRPPRTWQRNWQPESTETGIDTDIITISNPCSTATRTAPNVFDTELTQEILNSLYPGYTLQGRWNEPVILDFTLPGSTFITQRGNSFLNYNTAVGGFLYDTQLKKWGKYKHPHRFLVEHAGTGLIAGPWNEGQMSLWDASPSDGFITYGKIGHYRGGFTHLQEVRLDFVSAPNAVITIEPSLHGFVPTQDTIVRKENVNTNTVKVFPNIRCQWANIKISGQWNLQYMEVTTEPLSGRR